MKCDDCGEQLVNLAGVFVCPNCDPGVFEEPTMNKTMEDEERLSK
jgi:uncharacterized Zn finger protein (UPF0148 family)